MERGGSKLGERRTLKEGGKEGIREKEGGNDKDKWRRERHDVHI